MATATKVQKVTSVENEEMEFFDEEEVFEMLAGYKDSDGIMHRTFTLRELDGADEEAIQSSNKRSNGSKVVSLILERCITSIGELTPKSEGKAKWQEIIKNLYVGDQDYIFLKIREVSLGKEFELSHDCPFCKAELLTYITSDELEIEPFNGIFENPFELPRGFKDKDGVIHKTGVIKHPKGIDREILGPTAQKNQAKGSTLMITRLCKFNDESVYVTEDLIRSLVLRDRKYLQELLSENLFGVNTDVEITCTSCGETFTGKFSPTNFI